MVERGWPGSRGGGGGQPSYQLSPVVGSGSRGTEGLEAGLAFCGERGWGVAGCSWGALRSPGGPWGCLGDLVGPMVL